MTRGPATPLAAGCLGGRSLLHLCSPVCKGDVSTERAEGHAGSDGRLVRGDVVSVCVNDTQDELHATRERGPPAP